MKYFFPDWMFVGGGMSHCFSAGENLTLSTLDIDGIKRLYPHQPAAAEAAKARQEAAKAELNRLKAKHGAIDLLEAAPAAE